ncbi:FAD-dependent monooxygenase [Candidatus Comchoanobacter bicostacola]|uniref:FAD-dependent monooxygenase n=1 Tax=Candidatus Comchoanobacter bicostacola TaxID=2919598 RepID=A0ABY5DL02_9GAMM|nr:FAD-dependent monooxygenase [Candidatus Comchoanobacter bicostacola]UTC24653.1 FAD-dependent monooxygenase [Candidatus Comchoanobacter bicostacola]
MIAIIGNGLSGLSFAQLCQYKGWPYEIIAPTQPGSNSKKLLLNHQSLTLLKEICPDVTPDHIYDSLTINIKNKPCEINFSASDYDLPGIAYAVSYNRLSELFSKKITYTQAHVHRLDYSQQRPVLNMSNASKKYQHVIACDGARSTIRSQLGIKQNKGASGVSIIIPAHINSKTLHIQFSQKVTGAILPGENGQIILSGTSALRQFTPTLQELKQFFPEYIDLVSIGTPIYISYQRAITHSNYAHNCLLLGESALSIPPIAAQGFNHTLAQINHLAELDILTPESIRKKSTYLAQMNQQLWQEMAIISNHPFLRNQFLNLAQHSQFLTRQLFIFGNRYA